MPKQISINFILSNILRSVPGSTSNNVDKASCLRKERRAADRGFEHTSDKRSFDRTYVNHDTCESGFTSSILLEMNTGFEMHQ